MISQSFEVRRSKLDVRRSLRETMNFERPTSNFQRRTRSAFTLVEMLTTVAVLVIVLGLMTSLARDVRTRSAERLTKDVLHRLDLLVAQYRQRSLKNIPEEQRKVYPAIQPLISSAVPEE